MTVVGIGKTQAGVSVPHQGEKAPQGIVKLALAHARQFCPHLFHLCLELLF